MEENKDTTAPEQEAQQTEENLTEQLEKATALANDYKDKWMRNVAEFDNYKKRNVKLWQEAFFEGKADVLLKILPIGDNLDTAISMGLDEKTAEGLVLLRRKFNDVLSQMEVEEINPVGEKFNPQIAEAVMQVEASENDESETVKQVFQKGYKIKDKIIRYAKVSVVK